MASPTTRDGGCSTSGTSLSTRVATIWYRGKVKVDRLLGDPPGTRITHEQTLHLPYEIMEMIIAHFIHDLDTLKACSLTCCSWYIIVVPHIHHTLTLKRERRGHPNPPPTRARLKPLSKLHQLGLAPLIKEIRVEQRRDMIRWFMPKAFSRCDLRHFSAFANIHTLRLQEPDINLFIPGIKRHFGHFSLTLRSITLYNPHCTPQQLSHFLSFFSNLDDIELRCTVTFYATPTKLVPFSTPAPKLRGRLALYGFRWVETWWHLIASCGGLRFRHIDLREDASCAPILFEACADTLETLRFNVPAASDRPFSTSELDLSQLTALRSLQVGAWVYESRLEDRRYAMVMEVFSTITSPVFSELVVVLALFETCLPWALLFFEALRTMNEVRPFKLVFLLEVLDFWEAQRELTEALDSATEKGLLEFLGSPPTIRRAQSVPRGWHISTPR